MPGQPNRKSRKVDKLDVIARHLLASEPLSMIAKDYGVTLRTIQKALRTGLEKMDFHSVSMLRGLAFQLTRVLGSMVPEAIDNRAGKKSTDLDNIRYRTAAAGQFQRLSDTLLKVLTRLDELDEMRSGEPTTKERSEAQALIEAIYQAWGYDPTDRNL